MGELHPEQREDDVHILLSSPLFHGINRSELKALLSCLKAERRTYGKGEYIFRMGDTITKFGVILSGSAHIERYDYWGDRHIISALLPGNAFGESFAAVPQTTAFVSVVTGKETSVIFLDLNKALHMCTSSCPFHARLISNIVSLLARKNLLLNKKLTYVTQHTLKDKILTYLSAESQRQHSAYFDIPYDRQQLADYLNAERSALSNELSKLKKQGVIDYQKNHFHLLTPPYRQA